MPQTAFSLPIRPVGEQVDLIASKVHAAKLRRLAISSIETQVTANRPVGANGVIAVMNPEIMGQPTSLMVALEVWGGISDWKLHTPVASLKGSLRNFIPNQFGLVGQTETAHKELSCKQNVPAWIIPARMEMVKNVALDSPREFCFDLTSTLWYLCTHWSRIQRLDGHNIQIACLGERYREIPLSFQMPATLEDIRGVLVPVVTVHNGKRYIQMRSESEVSGMQRIVGVLP